MTRFAFILFLLLAVGLIFFSVIEIGVAADNDSYFSEAGYYPGIPGFEDPSIIFSEETLPTEAFPLFASYIFSLLFVISIVVTFGVISYAGLLYLVSRGNVVRVRAAKEWLSNAMQGMLIVFASYSLFSAIDSNFLTLSFTTNILDASIYQQELIRKIEAPKRYYQIPVGLIAEKISTVNRTGEEKRELEQKFINVYNTTVQAEEEADKFMASIDIMRIIETCPIGLPCDDGSKCSFVASWTELFEEEELLEDEELLEEYQELFEELFGEDFDIHQQMLDFEDYADILQEMSDFEEQDFYTSSLGEEEVQSYYGMIVLPYDGELMAVHVKLPEGRSIFEMMGTFDPYAADDNYGLPEGFYLVSEDDSPAPAGTLPSFDPSDNDLPYMSPASSDYQSFSSNATYWGAILSAFGEWSRAIAYNEKNKHFVFLKNIFDELKISSPISLKFSFVKRNLIGMENIIDLSGKNILARALEEIKLIDEVYGNICTCSCPDCPEINPPINTIIENEIVPAMGRFSSLIVRLDALKEPFVDGDLRDLFKIMVAKSLSYRVIINHDTYARGDFFDNIEKTDIVTAPEWIEWIDIGRDLPKILKPPNYRNKCEATFYVRDGVFEKDFVLDNFLKNVDTLTEEGAARGLQSFGFAKKAKEEDQISSNFLQYFAESNKKEEKEVFGLIRGYLDNFIKRLKESFVAFGFSELPECRQDEACAEDHCLYEGECIPRISEEEFAQHTELGLEIPIGEVIELTWNYIIQLLHNIDRYNAAGEEFLALQAEYNAMVSPCECPCLGDGCVCSDSLSSSSEPTTEPPPAEGIPDPDSGLSIEPLPDLDVYESPWILETDPGPTIEWTTEPELSETIEGSSETICVCQSSCQLTCDKEAIRRKLTEIIAKRTELRWTAERIYLLTAGFFRDPVNFDGYERIDNHTYMADVCFYLNADIRTDGTVEGTEDEIAYCAIPGNSKAIFMEELIERKINLSRAMFNSCTIGEGGRETYIFAPVAEAENRTKMTKARALDIDGNRVVDSDGRPVYWTTSDFNWFCF